MCVLSDLDGLTRQNADTVANRSSGDEFYRLLENASSVENEFDDDALASASEVIEGVDEFLFANVSINSNQEEGGLLEDCFNGTFLETRALDSNPQSTLYRTFKYAFRVNILLNVSNLLQRANSSFASGLFFRFVLCNAERSGFCNPFVRTPVDKKSTIVPVPASQSLWDIVDSDQKMVFTPWAIPVNAKLDIETNQITLEELEVHFTVSKGTPIGEYHLILHAMLVLSTNDDSNTLIVHRLDVAAKAEVSDLACSLVHQEGSSHIVRH